MLSKNKVLFLLVILLVLSRAGFTEDKEYLDFKIFKAMLALVPEMPQALPAGGLTPAGYELWKKGQLQLPVNRNFLNIDLDEDGKKESILLLKVEDDILHHYILIARQGEKKCERLLLQPLEGKVSGIEYDEKRKAISIGRSETIRLTSSSAMVWPRDRSSYGYVLEIEKPDYLFWKLDSKNWEYLPCDRAVFSPWLLRTNLALYKSDFAPEHFRNAHLKFTYFGSQDRPIQGLYLFCPDYTPNLELFKIYYRSAINYGNDGMGALKYLQINPAEMQKIVLAMANFKGVVEILKRTGNEQGDICFSVSLVTINDMDLHFVELLLSWKETKVLLLQIQKILEEAKPIAHEQLKDYLKMF